MSIRMYHLLNKAWVLRFAQAALLIFVCAFTSNTFAGVREDLNKAKIYYEKGHLPQAAKILQRIVSKYPDNKAAYYLLGRVFYRSGQIKNAAKAFKRSGRDFLDGSGAFEYGITMFAVNDCPHAVRGFAKVKDDKQKGIANFYAGVCYFKMHDYFAAEQSMRRAKDIPGNFEATRRRVLLEIQKRKNEERVGVASPSTPYVPLPQMPQAAPYYYPAPYAPQQPGLPPGPGAPKQEDYDAAAEQKKSEPAKPVQGLSFAATPRIEYLYSSDTSNRHGHGSETDTKQGPQGGGDFNAYYKLAPNKKGEQVVFTLPLNVKAKNQQSSTKDVSYTQNERLEGEVLTETKETNTNSKSLAFTVKPSVSVPVNESIDLDGGGKYAETWPDFKQELKETEKGGFGSVSVGFGDIILKANGSMSNFEKLNSDGAIVDTTDQTFGGGADVTLPWSLSLNLTASFSNTSNPSYGSLDGYSSTQSFGGGLTRAWETVSVSTQVNQSTSTQPPSGVITGTADQTKFTADITKNFKLGINIKLYGEYTLINQYEKTGLCTTDSNGALSDKGCSGSEQTADATGTRTGYGLEVKFTPVEWVYATANYSTKNTVYALKQKELQADFEDKVTDSVTSMSFLVGLSASF